MIINKAMKLRLYSNRDQQILINRTLGSCRFVYNHMLVRNNRIYARRGEHLSGFDMCYLLPGMKKYLPWLKEPDSHALQNACRNLDRAFAGFFSGKAEYPVFHSKRGVQSYTTDCIHISDDLKHVKLAKIGVVKARGFDRRVRLSDITVKHATVSKNPDGRYYCSVCYETEIPDTAVCEPKAVIGLDYKIAGLYVDSDGNSAGKPGHFKRQLKKLRHEQKALSRKQGSRKGEAKSKNYVKQLKKVNRIHSKVADQRQDFLQKQSTAITKRYDVICIEDLSVKQLYLTPETEPCRRKRQNINRAIADDSWYSFVQMLAYKAGWTGKRLIKVSRDYPSSETCSCCGAVNPAVKDLAVRKWICPSCGAVHDRDVNAAVNIRNEGMYLMM